MAEKALTKVGEFCDDDAVETEPKTAICQFQESGEPLLRDALTSLRCGSVRRNGCLRNAFTLAPHRPDVTIVPITQPAGDLQPAHPYVGDGFRWWLPVPHGFWLVLRSFVCRPHDVTDGWAAMARFPNGPGFPHSRRALHRASWTRHGHPHCGRPERRNPRASAARPVCKLAAGRDRGNRRSRSGCRLKALRPQPERLPVERGRTRVSAECAYARERSFALVLTSMKRWNKQ